MSKIEDLPSDIIYMITERLSFSDNIKLTLINEESNKLMLKNILKEKSSRNKLLKYFRKEDFKTLEYYLRFVEKNKELHDEIIFQDFDGKKLLNYSIQLKLNKIAKILLSIAISLDGNKFLNSTNQFGETPFFAAVKFKNNEIINELLNLKYKNIKLNLTRYNTNGESIMIYSLRYNYTEVLKELVNQGKIRRLFLICCRKGHMRILKNEYLEIVKHIQKLTIVEKRELINDGIFEAIENNHLNVIKFIVDKFKKNHLPFVNIPKKTAHKYGFMKVSTLLLAAINNRESIVNYLIQKNIKIDKFLINMMNEWEIKQSIIEKVINKFDNLESYEDSEEYKYFHDDFTLY